MKIIFFGTPDFVVPVLNSLSTSFDVVGVVTTPDTREGRKKILTPSPVKKAYLAKNPDGTVLTPQQLNNEILQELQSLNPDLFVVAAYGKIIPQSILDIPAYGSINIHPSLLPKYRGPSPIQSAILDGEKITGVSIILMDSQMDHGPLLSQWEHPISDHDTFASLHHILFQQAAEKLPNVIKEFIQNKLTPHTQDESQATYCQKIEKEDGHIELNAPPPPDRLDRMIRAFYPWPTVSTKITLKNGEQKTMKLLPEKKIQIEGKNVMSIKDFLNGYPTLKETINRLGLGN